MSFYIVTNGKIIQHQFDYLNETTGRRLERTLAPQDRRVIDFDDRGKYSWVIEIMSKNVITMDSSETVDKAIETFKNNHIHHIPLRHNHSLVGMISDRDVMWLKLTNIDKVFTLEKFMSKVVVSCDEDTPIDYLAHVFYKEHINGMPVINKNKELVGIVTHTDILHWIYDK